VIGNPSKRQSLSSYDSRVPSTLSGLKACGPFPAVIALLRRSLGSRRVTSPTAAPATLKRKPTDLPKEILTIRWSSRPKGCAIGRKSRSASIVHGHRYPFRGPKTAGGTIYR